MFPPPRRASRSPGPDAIFVPRSVSVSSNGDEIIGQPFRHNPLHDMENLWWIAAYFVVNREVVDPSLEKSLYTQEMRALAQRELAIEIFENHRQEFLKKLGYFSECVFQLHSSLKSVTDALNHARTCLCAAFAEAEPCIDLIDHSAAENVYHAFRTSFRNVIEGLRGRDIKLRRLER